MRAVVESIQGRFVRCLLENGEILTVSQNHLSHSAKEGDVVQVKLELDQEQTRKQKEFMTSYTS